jgi:hypothetical protein
MILPFPSFLHFTRLTSPFFAMNRWHITFVAAAALCGGAFAGELAHPEALLDRLAGQWVLSGKIAGRETTHDISADWTLNHGYLRIHEVSREKGPSGEDSYEAIIFISYNAKTEDYTCLWLDSTSNEGLNAEGLAHARRRENSLPFVFRDSKAQVSFENTFVYDPASDSWKWIMDNVEAEKRKPFGRVTLVKRAPPDKAVPNKAPRTTPGSVTPPAAQKPRQP